MLATLVVALAGGTWAYRLGYRHGDAAANQEAVVRVLTAAVQRAGDLNHEVGVIQGQLDSLPSQMRCQVAMDSTLRAVVEAGLSPRPTCRLVPRR